MNVQNLDQAGKIVFVQPLNDVFDMDVIVFV